MNKATIGTVSAGTMIPGNLFSAFSSELEWLDPKRYAQFKQDFKDLYKALSTDTDEYEYDDAVNALFDILDTYAPDGCYFGAHGGDGADYGFWPLDEDQP